MAQQARVLIIGAGVIGLTTALTLRRRGFDVAVLADDFTPTSSAAAGALWEWPPSVCGSHHDEAALGRLRAWCMPSYRKFAELAKTAGAGVFMRPATFYFTTSTSDNALELAKMKQLAENVPGFIHDPALAAQNSISPLAGVVDAYRYIAPMIDTDAYLSWLQTEVVTAGCDVIEGHLSGMLSEQEGKLRRDFHAEAIVNCSGLGSLKLAGDLNQCPHRGALIFVHNDGRHMPRVTGAHCVAHDTSQAKQDMIFIVPRGGDMLVLGGLIEPGEWNLDLDLQSYAPAREMLERCIDFLPALADAQLDERQPLRAGLRPFREGGVRLEREPGTRIIHNYGHGGSGFTLSWGCALETAELVTQSLELQAQPTR